MNIQEQAKRDTYQKLEDCKLIISSKRKVFDDIDWIIGLKDIKQRLRFFEQIKKKHLNTQNTENE